jgi:hypothetical protein
MVGRQGRLGASTRIRETSALDIERDEFYLLPRIEGSQAPASLATLRGHRREPESVQVSQELPEQTFRRGPSALGHGEISIGWH